MTLNEFRESLEAWWLETDAREVARKNSQGALLAFIDLYERLDSDERELADRIIAEWVASGNERKRFDALAMVDHFRIRAATAQLKTAEAELAERKDPEAPYELAKVRRILVRVES
jgi:hypothetical protein